MNGYFIKIMLSDALEQSEQVGAPGFLEIAATEKKEQRKLPR